MSTRAGRVTVTLAAAPGAGYFDGHGPGEALDLHWQHVLTGMAQGFDDAMCRFRFSIPELVSPQESALLDPSQDRPRRAGPP